MCDEAPRHVFNSICRYVNQVYTSLQSLCSYYALPRQSNLRVILRNPSAFLHARYIFLLILLPPISPQIFPIFLLLRYLNTQSLQLYEPNSGGRPQIFSQTTRKCPGMLVVCSPFPARKYERPERWIFEGRSGDLRAFVSAGRVILKFSTNAYHRAVKVTPRLTQRTVVVVVMVMVVVKLCIRAVFAHSSFFPLPFFFFFFFSFPFSLNLPFLPRALPLPDLSPSLYPMKNVHEYLTFQRANIQRRYSNFT